MPWVKRNAKSYAIYVGVSSCMYEATTSSRASGTAMKVRVSSLNRRAIVGGDGAWALCGEPTADLTLVSFVSARSPVRRVCIGAQFKSEADAKSHCGTDQVVWGNTSSHVLHNSGTKAPTCARGLQSMQATTRPRNRNLFRFDTGLCPHAPSGGQHPPEQWVGLPSIRIVVDVAVMPFGHKHQRPVHWLVRS